jgi:hypothetical protein
MTTVSSELLTYCKTSLRLTSTVFDSEVNQLIAAAEADITQATDSPFSADDEVQCQAVALYCQAYFGYGDEKAERRYQDVLQRIGLRKIKDLNQGDS